MKLHEMGTLITIVVIVVAAVVGFGSYYITKTEDSLIEESAEAILESELGLENGYLDFTPNTPER